LILDCSDGRYTLQAALISSYCVPFLRSNNNCLEAVTSSASTNCPAVFPCVVFAHLVLLLVGDQKSVISQQLCTKGWWGQTLRLAFNVACFDPAPSRCPPRAANTGDWSMMIASSSRIISVVMVLLLFVFDVKGVRIFVTSVFARSLFHFIHDP